MHYQSSQTAILVFIREEREEARIKSFRERRSFRESLRVVRALNKHVTKITRRSGLPTFLVKGTQQIGYSFGERFAHAIESVFLTGYQSVISIGNDCLSLNAHHLQAMAEALERGATMVLGPAKDGGAYAIGMQRDAFQKSEFIQLPWESAELFSALLHYSKNLNASIYCLPVAIDADDASSFQAALMHLVATSPLYRLFEKILQSTEKQIVEDVIFNSIYLKCSAHLRAPPDFLS